MLQSKPVRVKGAVGVREDASADAVVIKDKIKSIQQRAHVISAVFARLCREVVEKSGSKLVPFVQGLSHQLQLFLLEYNSQYSVGQFPGYNHQAHGARLDIDRQQRQMMELCGRLREAVAGHGMADD